jgi:molybdopterin-guanine dinucleotide biosynthesis protein A
VRVRGPGGSAAELRAATLGAAAAALGLSLDRQVAALNGDRIGHDPLEPLAEGDEVALMAADAGS